MIKLWQFLLHGCWHSWKPTGQSVEHYDISFGARSYMYTAHVQRCEKCSRISSYKERSGASGQ